MFKVPRTIISVNPDAEDSDTSGCESVRTPPRSDDGNDAGSGAGHNSSMPNNDERSRLYQSYRLASYQPDFCEAYMPDDSRRVGGRTKKRWSAVKMTSSEKLVDAETRPSLVQQRKKRWDVDGQEASRVRGAVNDTWLKKKAEFTAKLDAYANPVDVLHISNPDQKNSLTSADHIINHSDIPRGAPRGSCFPPHIRYKINQPLQPEPTFTANMQTASSLNKDHHEKDNLMRSTRAPAARGTETSIVNGLEDNDAFAKSDKDLPGLCHASDAEDKDVFWDSKDLEDDVSDTGCTHGSDAASLHSKAGASPMDDGHVLSLADGTGMSFDIKNAQYAALPGRISLLEQLLEQGTCFSYPFCKEPPAGQTLPYILPYPPGMEYPDRKTDPIPPTVHESDTNEEPTAKHLPAPRQSSQFISEDALKDAQKVLGLQHYESIDQRLLEAAMDMTMDRDSNYAEAVKAYSTIARHQDQIGCWEVRLRQKYDARSELPRSSEGSQSPRLDMDQTIKAKTERLMPEKMKDGLDEEWTKIVLAQSAAVIDEISKAAEPDARYAADSSEEDSNSGHEKPTPDQQPTATCSTSFDHRLLEAIVKNVAWDKLDDKAFMVSGNCQAHFEHMMKTGWAPSSTPAAKPMNADGSVTTPPPQEPKCFNCTDALTSCSCGNQMCGCSVFTDCTCPDRREKFLWGSSGKTYNVSYWATVKNGVEEIHIPIDSKNVSGAEKNVLDDDMRKVWNWVHEKDLGSKIGLQDAFDLALTMHAKDDAFEREIAEGSRMQVTDENDGLVGWGYGVADDEGVKKTVPFGGWGWNC